MIRDVAKFRERGQVCRRVDELSVPAEQWRAGDPRRGPGVGASGSARSSSTADDWTEEHLQDCDQGERPQATSGEGRTANESVRLDVRYVENWSATLNASILWKNVVALITGRGAY